MKNVCTVTNTIKDKDLKVTDELVALLEKSGIHCVRIRPDEETGRYRYVNPSRLPQDTEGIIVLGGDGTLIGVARDLYGKNIPLLGVNLGTLGYLTEVEVHKMGYAVEMLAQNKYTIEERMMIKGSVFHARRDDFGKESGKASGDIALNDIVIGRTGHMRLLNIIIYVNGKKLHSYDADGLIVSTPTGSTAYNLSAGGPIVEPTASMIVITPICSHELGVSCVVLSGDDIVEAEIGPGRKQDIEEASVAYDGESLKVLRTGDRIRIEKAREKTGLMNLSAMSFIETLRKKMKYN
mgnify:CR=1 FL=1